MTQLIKQSPSNRFKDHLDISDNIFFSGVYGIGKTTYLNKKFNREKGEFRDEYISFHLYPVNYSVAENKDIFELIKYDLLYQIMEYLDIKDLLDNNDIYKSKTARYIAKNYSNIFLSFLKCIPEIGGTIEKVESTIDHIIKGYNKLNNDETQSKLERFSKIIEETKGSIYEQDFYTELIKVLLKLIKEKNSNKETVLIIDDLDRIDPHHIFRLLNIFSAHLEFDNNKNKFNIDKIIFVGDIENISSIFHHIYGKNTDFKGYMDKFYTNEIFHLTIEDNISSIFKDYFFNTEISSYIIKDFLIEILVTLFENKKINLRQIKKIDNIISETIYEFKNDNALKIFLLKLYGNDIISLKNSISSCSNLKKHKEVDKGYYAFIIKNLVKTIYTYNLNKIVTIDSDKFNYKLKNNMEFQFRKIEHFNGINLEFVHEIDYNNINFETLWDIFIDSL